MPLSEDQRKRLIARARAEGIDPDELMTAAEQELDSAPAGHQPPSDDGGDPDAASSDEPGNLFMYLLPFVTVGEVRRVWLKLKTPLPGVSDTENAAAWAAKMAAAAAPGAGARADLPPADPAAEPADPNAEPA